MTLENIIRKLDAKFTSIAINNGLAVSAEFIYYLKDHLNTVNEITNAAGKVNQFRFTNFI